jgi:acetyltransferase-like isoleucine patch superfamily enzyme
MFIQIKNFVRQKPTLVRFILHPITSIVGWLYGAYLTIRYVDHYQNFPAIKFKKLIFIRMKKARGSKLIINNRLIIEPWQGGMAPSSITLGRDAELIIHESFIIGDDVRILLAPSAKLTLHGVNISSGSGITCKSVILVNKHVEIGKDTIIAWDTFITDCDWHPINGKLKVFPTIIGDHVWIGVGCKILKGVLIGQDSIIAPQSVVLAGKYPEKVLLAGIPAKVIKTSIDMWSRD